MWYSYFDKEIKMIKNFIHKGLEKFFLYGMTSGIQPSHQKKLSIVLSLLNSAKNIKDLNFPGSGLHQLKGCRKDIWSIKVNGNWRITFYFENGDAYIVNYEDYH